MLKNLLSNPVSRTFIALMIAVAAVLGAFLTYVTAPVSFGETDIRFDNDTVFYFADDWSLAYDFMQFEFAPGTLVVPGYHRGRVTSVLIIAPEEHPGSMTLQLPQEHRGDLPEIIQDNLKQVLIMLDYTDYKKIIRDTGDTILLRAQDVEIPERYLTRQLDYGYGLLTSYNLYGFTNWLPPTSQTVLVRLWGQRMGTFTYYEDAHVYVDGTDFTVSFTHPKLEQQFYPPEGHKIRALLYMVFLGIAAAGLTGFIAGGLENQHKEVRGEYAPLWTAAALSGALLYALLLTLFEFHFQPSLLGMAALWVLPLLLIAAWARQARLEPQFFGITTHGLMVGVVGAMAVSIFIALGSTFTLPTGLNFNLFQAVSLLLATVFREALLRGFCQRILSHWLEPLAGLLIVSVIWALIVAGSGLAGGPGFLLPLVSAMGRSLLVGYMFYRTNNLLASGLLATLLEIGPMMLVF
jgi:membrane protease YdiL (CAAX protease family)